MATSDKNLPVSPAFPELLEAAKAGELAELGAAWQRDKEANERLRLAQQNAALTTSQAFIPTERTDEKMKGYIEQTMTEIEKAAKKAAEEQSSEGKDEDSFPPPPMTTR